jgi:osmotically inducible protein OsmC
MQEEKPMPERLAQATWEGSLHEGRGVMKFGDGQFEGSYTWSSRFEEAGGTNPELLIGAAHAGCFSMALSGDLGKAGFTPKRITTQATVTLGRVDGKARITKIHLDTEAEVPEIDQESFMKIAEGSKAGCPVSVALAGVEISLSARLV